MGDKNAAFKTARIHVQDVPSACSRNDLYRCFSAVAQINWIRLRPRKREAVVCLYDKRSVSFVLEQSFQVFGTKLHLSRGTHETRYNHEIKREQQRSHNILTPLSPLQAFRNGRSKFWDDVPHEKAKMHSNSFKYKSAMPRITTSQPSNKRQKKLKRHKAKKKKILNYCPCGAAIYLVDKRFVETPSLVDFTNNTDIENSCQGPSLITDYSFSTQPTVKRIFVRSTTNYSIEVSDTPTLSEVQQKVQNKEGITCNLQHILYRGSTLSEETAVGLQNEDNIHVLVKGKGGMREIFKSKEEAESAEAKETKMKTDDKGVEVGAATSGVAIVRNADGARTRGAEEVDKNGEPVARLLSVLGHDLPDGLEEAESANAIEKKTKAEIKRVAEQATKAEAAIVRNAEGTLMGDAEEEIMTETYTEVMSKTDLEDGVTHYEHKERSSSVLGQDRLHGPECRKNKAELVSLKIKFVWQERKTGSHIQIINEDRKAYLEVTVTPESKGINERIQTGFGEVTLQKQTFRTADPFILCVEFKQNEVNLTSHKRQHVDIIRLHCSATDKQIAQVFAWKCRLRSLENIHIVADHIVAMNDIQVCGCMTLEAYRGVRLRSHITCNETILESKYGNVIVENECMLQTCYLRSFAIKTSILGRVCQLLTKEFRVIQTSSVKIYKGKTFCIDIHGRLHVGTDGRLGTNELNNQNNIVVSDSLRLNVTENIYNFGIIMAFSEVELICKNIMSGRSCKDDTVQRGFSAFECMNISRSTESFELFSSEPREGLHQAIQAGSIKSVAKSLWYGADPYAPAPKTGKTAIDLAIKTLQAANQNRRTERNDPVSIHRKIISLISLWQKRSGYIVSDVIICRVSEDIHDCSQLTGKHVQLNVGGNITVEENSIWTSGTVSGKCCGNVEIRGTGKLQYFESFVVSNNFIVDQRGIVIIGNGGSLIVGDVFYNRNKFYNSMGQIYVITNVLSQDEKCILGSLEKIKLKIHGDSNNLKGKIQGDSICLTIAAQVIAGCEIIANTVCAVEISKRLNDDKNGQLFLTELLEVTDGFLVAVMSSKESNTGNRADIIFESLLRSRGIMASTVHIQLNACSETHIFPQEKGPAMSDINVFMNSLTTEPGSMLYFNTESHCKQIHFICHNNWHHMGTFTLEKPADDNIYVSFDISTLINFGHINNFSNMKITVIELLDNHKQMSIKESLSIYGRGTLINENTGSIVCKTGPVIIRGTSLLINRHRGQINGNDICIETMEGIQPHTYKSIKSFDIRNRGSITGKQEVRIIAGNIDNKRGTIQSLWSFTELSWTTKRHKSAQISGLVLVNTCAAFTANSAKQFIFKCKGGKSKTNESRNHEDFSIQDDKIDIQCPEGCVVIDNNISGSYINITAKKGLTVRAKMTFCHVDIKRCVVHTLGYNEIVSNSVCESNKDNDNVNELAVHEIISEESASLNSIKPEPRTNISHLKGGDIFSLVIANNGLLAMDMLMFYLNSACANVILKTYNCGKLACSNSLKADCHFLIDGDMEISKSCSIKAHHLTFSPASKCYIFSSEKSTNENAIHICSVNSMNISGTIVGHADIDKTVVIECLKGGIKHAGSAKLTNLTIKPFMDSDICLSGQLRIEKQLQLITAETVDVHGASLTCSSFVCRPSSETDLRSPALTFYCGSVTVNGEIKCHLNSFRVFEKGRLSVYSNATQDDVSIVVLDTVSLSGTLQCNLKGRFIIAGKNALTLDNLNAEIRARECILTSMKKITISNACSLIIECPYFRIINAETTNEDCAGNIEISGKIKADQPSTSTVKSNTNKQMGSNLIIKGYIVHFADVKIYNFDEANIRAENCIQFNDNCSLQANKMVKLIAKVSVWSSNIVTSNMIVESNNVRMCCIDTNTLDISGRQTVAVTSVKVLDHAKITAESIELTGNSDIQGVLKLLANCQIRLLQNANIVCKHFYCVPDTDEDFFSSQKVLIESGSLNVKGTCHCVVETMLVSSEGDFSVVSEEADDYVLIRSSKELVLSGKVNVTIKGRAKFDSAEGLTFQKLSAGIRAESCSLTSAKAFNMDSDSSLFISKGTCFIGSTDKNTNCDIAIMGKITGGTHKSCNDISSSSLSIEGCSVLFKTANIQQVDRFELFGALSVTLDKDSHLRDGHDLKIETSTLDVEGEISFYKTIFIDASNVLVSGTINQSAEIKILTDFATVNTGAISGKKTGIVAPIYLNCPASGEDCSKRLEPPSLGDDYQNVIIVEGLLCISIGSVLASKKLVTKAVLSFEFATQKTTVPTKDNLHNWKKVIDSPLQELAKSSSGKEDVERIVKEAMKIPKVICNLGTASVLCMDIVSMCNKIQKGGLDQFYIDELIGCLNKAHTQYSKISPFALNINLKKGFKRIKDASKQIAKPILEKFFPGSFSSTLSFSTDDLEHGIEATTYLYEGKHTETKTDSSFKALSLKVNGMEGIWKNEGHIEACGDISISANYVQQKGKDKKLLKALQSIVTILGETVDVDGVKSASLAINASDSVTLESADISDRADIVASKAAVVKSTRAKDLNVDADQSVSVQNTNTTGCTNLDGGIVEGTAVTAGNLKVSGSNDIHLKALSSDSTEIAGLSGVTIDGLTSEQAHIKCSKHVTMKNVTTNQQTYIKARSATVKDATSNNMTVETKENISIGQVNAMDLNATSDNGNVTLDAKVKADTGVFKTPGGAVSFVGNTEKAPHEFNKLAVISKRIKDIIPILNQSGVYKDFKVAEQMDLAVDDQNIILANIRKIDFGLSIKAKNIDITGDLETNKDIKLQSKSALTMRKDAKIRTEKNATLEAEKGLRIQNNASILAGDDIYMQSNMDSIVVQAASVKAKGTITMDAKEDINVTANGSTNATAHKSVIEAGGENKGTSINITAGKNITIHASDIKSEGRNCFDAGKDIDITAHIHETETYSQQTSWFGLVTETQRETATHVDGTSIIGAQNEFKAGRNFTSKAASLVSEKGQKIHAKESVSMTDIKTTTIVDSTTNVLGGLMYHENNREFYESSHGTYLKDFSESADSSVVSDNSDITWCGSSVETSGNFVEKASNGKITHERTILNNQQRTMNCGFNLSEGGIQWRYSNGSKSFETTSDACMKIGGNYSTEAGEFHILNSFDINVDKNMQIDTKNVIFKGAELQSSESNFAIGIGTDTRTLKLGLEYSHSTSAKQKNQSLRVGENCDVRNVSDALIENCEADLGSLEGEIEHMKVESRRDTHTHLDVGLDVGLDIATRIPEYGLKCGIGTSAKVSSPTHIHVRGKSEGLTLQTLTLTGAQLGFDGDVHNFAKHIVTNEVHELEENLAVAVSVSKGNMCPGKPKNKCLNIKANLSKGRLLSCISSNTGNIDAAITERVNTEKEKCRTRDFAFSFNVNLHNSPVKSVKSIAADVKTNATFKTIFARTLSQVGSISLPEKMLDSLEAFFLRNNRAALINYFCSEYFGSKNMASMATAVEGILMKSKTKEEMVNYAIDLFAIWFSLPGNLVSDIKYIIQCKDLVLKTDRGRVSLKSVLIFVGIPHSVVKSIIELLEICQPSNQNKVLKMILLAGKKLGLPDEELKIIEEFVLKGEIRSSYLKQKLGLSDLESSVVQAVIKNHCSKDEIRSLLVIFAGKFFSSDTNTKLIEPFIKAVTIDNWPDRIEFVIAHLTTYFGISDECSKGLIDCINKRDPTTFATWFAKKVQINEHILIALMNGILKHKDTIGIMRDLLKAVGVPEPAVKIIEGVIRQYMLKGNAKSSHNSKSDMSPQLNREFFSTVCGILKSSLQTEDLKELFSTFLDQFDLPEFAKEALLEISAGKPSVKTAVKLIVSQFGKSDLQSDMLDALETLIIDGDYTLLVTWVCKSVCSNECLKSLITNLIEARDPNEILMNSVNCVATYFGISADNIFAIEFLLKTKENLLKSVDGCKVIKPICELIGIPNDVSEIIIMYCKSAEHDLAHLGSKIIQIIGNKIGKPEILTKIKEDILTRCIDGTFLKQTLPLSDLQISLLQDLMKGKCSKQKFHSLLVSVLSSVFDSKININRIETIVNLIKADTWHVRVEYVFKLFGNHFNIPADCVKGLLDIIQKQDPTTLATWFAEQVGIKSGIVITLAKGLMSKKDIIMILCDITNDMGVPEPAAKMLENIFRQTVPKARQFLTKFDMPIYMKTTFIDISNGNLSLSSSLSMILKKFSSVCLPADMINVLEAFVTKGDRKLLVSWVCKSVNINSHHVCSLIDILLDSKGSKGIVNKSLHCIAQHIGMSDKGLHAIGFILDQKGNIFKTREGCKALKLIGEEIRVPPIIIEMAVEYLKCPKQEEVALKIIQIIGNYFDIPLKDVNQLKHQVLKRCINSKKLKKKLHLSDSMVTALQELMNGICGREKFFKFIISVASDRCGLDINRKVVKPCIDIIRAKHISERVTYMVQIFASYFDLPDVCVTGCQEMLLNRDPTKLATWFAEKLGIHKDVIVTLAKGIVNSKDPLAIVSEMGMTLGLPENIVKVFEGTLRQQCQNKESSRKE